MALKDHIKIMVVDDMSVSRGLVFNCLDTIGIKNYVYATEGKGALNDLMKSPVHLVISDYNMPGMDGLDLLKALREHKPTSKIGFILLTGSQDKGLIDRGKKLGMNNYLAKPFQPEDLKKCMERVVGSLG